MKALYEIGKYIVVMFGAMLLMLAVFAVLSLLVGGPDGT